MTAHPCRATGCTEVLSTAPARASHERHIHGRTVTRRLHGFNWATFEQRTQHRSSCRAKASDVAPGRP